MQINYRMWTRKLVHVFYSKENRQGETFSLRKSTSRMVPLQPGLFAQAYSAGVTSFRCTNVINFLMQYFNKVGIRLADSIHPLQLAHSMKSHSMSVLNAY